VQEIEPRPASDYFVNRRKPRKPRKADKALQAVLDVEERRRNAGEKRTPEQIAAEEEAKLAGRLTFKYC